MAGLRAHFVTNVAGVARSEADVRVIVVGAGIGGLAAGIALRRAGSEVEMFERAEVMQDVGAGLSLWANAIHALDRLGLGDRIRALSTPYAAAGLRTWDGRVLTAPPPDLERRLGVLCVVVHRAELLEALLETFEPAGLHLGARCERVQQDECGVTAELSGGRHVRGDVLIGADGLHSVVRAQLHGDEPPRYAGYTAWRGVVAFDTGRVRASESWGYGTRFGQVPMGGGRVYWFATENTSEGGRNPDEKAHLLRLFRGWHAPIEELIRATPGSEILRNDIHDRPTADRWGEGRLTLLGDAAHPMTPNLGQGACQALEDAVVLARCLGQQPDPAMALRQYEAERLPRTNTLVTLSRRVGTIGQFQQPLAVYLRNAAMSRISPRRQARQLERIVGYRVG